MTHSACLALVRARSHRRLSFQQAPVEFELRGLQIIIELQEAVHFPSCHHLPLVGNICGVTSHTKSALGVREPIRNAAQANRKFCAELSGGEIAGALHLWIACGDYIAVLVGAFYGPQVRPWALRFSNAPEGNCEQSHKVPRDVDAGGLGLCTASFFPPEGVDRVLVCSALLFRGLTLLGKLPLNAPPGCVTGEDRPGSTDNAAGEVVVLLVHPREEQGQVDDPESDRCHDQVLHGELTHPATLPRPAAGVEGRAAA